MSLLWCIYIIVLIIMTACILRSYSVEQSNIKWEESRYNYINYDLNLFGF